MVFLASSGDEWAEVVQISKTTAQGPVLSEFASEFHSPKSLIAHLAFHKTFTLESGDTLVSKYTPSEVSCPQDSVCSASG